MFMNYINLHSKNLLNGHKKILNIDIWEFNPLRIS